MATVVGIDLGTTNSLAAYLDAGRPQVIPNASGARSTPSVVGLDLQGRLHVGASAKNQLVVMPERTVAESKRLMGSSETIRLGDRTYTPTEIAAILLRAVREDAERFLGTAVEEAIVTVPAYFTDAQRQATKTAGEIAGLRVERILNEPTAAALAYGIDHLDKEEYVVVYDLGGGTFDVSVLEMFGGVLDVKASSGNNRLGGGDFDRLLVGWLRARFEKEHGVDLGGDRQAVARLTEAAERAKVELSGAHAATVRLPFLVKKDGRDLSLEAEITRADLDALIGDLVRSTLACVDSALSDAKVARNAVAQIVLVGGSSRVPLVRSLVAEYFGKETRADVHPDEAIALGAAVQAGLKTGAISAQTGIMITDVAPFTLGVEVQASAGSQSVSGVFAPLIPRNSTIPIARTERYVTAADGQKSVTVRVFQGESRFTKNNVFLDEYTIDGVPPAPAGKEAVAIGFTYDINGILNVTTEIVSTGKKASLVVDKSPRRMTSEERARAKERLDTEWTGTAARAPAARAPADDPAKEGLKELVRAARERIPKAPVGIRETLERLLADAEEAMAADDRVSMAKLDSELTDRLFEMD